MNQKPENDESLNKVLRQWGVDSPLPPRFQEQVWQRISRAEPQPKASLWASFLRLVEVGLPRPKISLTYVAILLLFGAVAGSWAAQFKSSRLDALLGSRYVQSVDPYKKAGLNR